MENLATNILLHYIIKNLIFLIKCKEKILVDKGKKCENILITKKE